MCVCDEAGIVVGKGVVGGVGLTGHDKLQRGHQVEDALKQWRI